MKINQFAIKKLKLIKKTENFSCCEILFIEWNKV